VHLVGFIIKKCFTMHGHMNVKKKKGPIMLYASLACKRVRVSVVPLF
jgi:hypothetical protein